MLLNDKVAIVTGGGSGIGEATSRRFAREGATVVVADTRLAKAETVASEINDNQGHALAIKVDVSEADSVAALVDATVTHFGRLDVMFNNAGTLRPGTVLELDVADWDLVMGVNVRSVYLGGKFAIPAMLSSGGGSIINMSSVAGLKGAPNLSAYNATKGGVRLFTKGVALECAQSRWPVRVNSVHPGVIDTPIWTKVNPEYFDEGENAVDLDTMAEEAVPMGLLGYPHDIANGVLFLASEESRYITGTELVIDGGLSA